MCKPFPYIDSLVKITDMNRLLRHIKLVTCFLILVSEKHFSNAATENYKRTFYPPSESNVDFASLEKQTLAFWSEKKIFQRSVEENPEDNKFVFYDGPPFANGRPHYGHLLTGYIKDTYGRHQTLKGRRVERRLGWDCHGLPAEMAAEKALNISGKTAVEFYGISKFNRRCKDEVLKYISAWDDYMIRQGRWADVEGGYNTMSRAYMESVMWAFKQLYLNGLVYESEKVVPYSYACQSPLSNFETRLDNCYRTKNSKAVTVAFEILKKPPRLENLEPPLKMLVWTTTPWTLPSNLALAVGRNITYTTVWMQPSYGNRTYPHQIYLFATSYMSRFQELCDKKGLYFQNIGIEFTYKDLVGLAYKPMFPYFANASNAFRVLVGDFVSASEGTGIVHLAPGFGEDDFELCKKHNITAVCPIDVDGRFNQQVKDFDFMRVFDANKYIIKYIKKRNSWFHSETYSHSYPHCWRSDTPLIYRTMPSWYVAVTKIKAKMVELNNHVTWIPGHVRSGIFGNWLQDAQDWAISRNRFWGTPIPVWKSDNPKYPRIDVYGSAEELEKDFKRKVSDLHRPFIDNLTRPNPDDPTGKSTMRRIPDIFDCWFDSGSMPFAQFHYPFENRDKFENYFPADFVTEYIAQTRGWFYTMFVLSTALFNKAPFKNCICHGVVLDTKGQKLSKRLDNYVDPAMLFTKVGSDPLRFLMLSRPVVVGDNLLIDKQGKSVEEVLRVVLKPIWNSYHFFTLYANSDSVEAKLLPDLHHYSSTMDKYILLKCFQAVHKIVEHLDAYDSQEACRVVDDFFDVLNNWYIRRSRDRFWRSGIDQDKLDAYNALYTVFNYILRATSPLLPFISDTIWRRLHFKEESVHLTHYPAELNRVHDNPIIHKMDFVRGICNAAMYLRKSNIIRVRQPLKKMHVYHKTNNKLLDDEYKKMIKEETNVKEIIVEHEFDRFAEDQLQLKFSVLGKRIPDNIKRIVQLVNSGKWRKVSDDEISIDDVAQSYALHKGEFDIRLKAKNKHAAVFDDGNGVIQLDLQLDDDLILEGYARDVIRNIQETRKQAGLDISDRIRVYLKTDSDKVKEAIAKWQVYIKDQTLAYSLEVVNILSQDLFSQQYDDVLVALRIYHEIT